MSKKIWVGLAVAMSCASVMASTIITTEQNVNGYDVHIPTALPPGALSAPTLVNGGVVANFDTVTPSFTYGAAVGSIGTAPGSGLGGTTGVTVDAPGGSPGATAFMRSDDTLGTLSGTILNGVVLSPGYLAGNRWASYLAFDFQSSAVAPSLVQLFLTDNTTTWYTTINLAGDTSWHTYMVWLSPTLDTWYQSPPNGTLPTSESTLSSYYMGLNILYANDAGTYNIDNFELGQMQWPDSGPINPEVPEPGTISMLGFALASMGLTFRRRLRTFLKR